MEKQGGEREWWRHNAAIEGLVSNAHKHLSHIVRAKQQHFDPFLAAFGENLHTQICNGAARFALPLPPLPSHNSHRLNLRGGATVPCFANLSASAMAASRAGGCQETDGGKHVFDIALGKEQVSKILEGVPVYTVSNSENEFVLVTDTNGLKSLSLLCFRKRDAESLLSQVRECEPDMKRGAKVVSVSLDKIFKLNAKGISFRFLPDPQQVKNAIQVKSKAGNTYFDGVPIFQSENLVLRSRNKRFVPIFFCKEDLDRALAKAVKQQQKGSQSSRFITDIQVGSFEDAMRKLDTNEESSGWGDLIFIPPGRDLVEHLGKALG